MYSSMSHDLSHSQSQLLGFQINPLSHIPLPINSLHLHLHLSSFYLCLLLQTLASNLHLHIQVYTLKFMFLIISGTIPSKKKVFKSKIKEIIKIL